ncbi:MAG: hypothetical protein BWX72_00733 [Firmicutes bacterium ADurb.Bin080]|nr:MAG: hypothetical protein BWX72_00733 [Firmicutes bacterium ADurb.Bin080]
MFTIKNRVRVGVSYLVLLAIFLLVSFLIRPISAAVNAGAFPFTAWFYSFINNFTSYTLWLFVFGGLISIGYIRGKGNEKFDIVFGLIATYTLVYFLVIAINDIFSSALVAGAIGKLRGSAVGARAYDWAGFFSGLLMLAGGTYFFFNAKFLATLVGLFKEVLGFSAHGEKTQAKWEDLTFGKEIIFEKKEKKQKGESFSEEEVEGSGAPATEKAEVNAEAEEVSETEKTEAPKAKAPKKKPVKKAEEIKEEVPAAPEEPVVTEEVATASEEPVETEDLPEAKEDEKPSDDGEKSE